MNDIPGPPNISVLSDAKWAVAELKQSLLAMSIELSDLKRELDLAQERELRSSRPATPPERAHPVPVALRVVQPVPVARKVAVRGRVALDGQKVRAVRLGFAGG